MRHEVIERARQTGANRFETRVSDVVERPRDASCYWTCRQLTQDHSRSLEMAPLDRSRTSSCWRSMVTMALFCIISEIKLYIGRKSRSFHTPPAFDATVRGSCRYIAMRCGVAKLDCSGWLPGGEKIDDTSIRLDTTCDGRTDGRTDIHLATALCADK